MTQHRQLIVVRHAKAEAFASTDHARALTERGRRQSAAAGGHLREQGLVPDHAVVSSSARTRATWAAMEQVMASGAEVGYDDAVYAGGTEELLAALRVVPAAARVVVLVGHQPAVGYLAHLLDDGRGEPEAVHVMLNGFPTASMAVFQIGVEWDELAAGTGRLIAFRPG